MKEMEKKFGFKTKNQLQTIVTMMLVGLCLL